MTHAAIIIGAFMLCVLAAAIPLAFFINRLDSHMKFRRFEKAMHARAPEPEPPRFNDEHGGNVMALTSKRKSR